MTKTEQARLALKNGDTKTALRIVSSFPSLRRTYVGKVIKRGYESLVNPRFYKQLGQDVELNITAAIAETELVLSK